MKDITVTASQYLIQQFDNFDHYAKKITKQITLAKKNQTDLIVFAEYAGLELASWINQPLLQQFDHIQTLLSRYLEFYKKLAAEHQIYIQPGTIPVKEGQKFFNRAFFFSPNETVEFQDKIFLTPFERQLGFLKPGNELKLFDTSFGKVAILICYDSEFPTLAQELSSAGAQLLLVPSCTETLHGFTRVAISSRARAIENQCYVVNACLVGGASWCDYIETNVGQAGIYAPADIGFPANGILAEGTLNAEELITFKLSWKKLDNVRRKGQVSNFNDSRIHDKVSVHTIHFL